MEGYEAPREGLNTHSVPTKKKAVKWQTRCWGGQEDRRALPLSDTKPPLSCDSNAQENAHLIYFSEIQTK